MTRVALSSLALILLFGTVHCSSSSESSGVNNNVDANAESPGDRIANLDTGAAVEPPTDASVFAEEDTLAEQQGPLCIGIKPPDDTFLPIEEPEPESDVDDGGDFTSDALITDANEPQDTEIADATTDVNEELAIEGDATEGSEEDTGELADLGDVIDGDGDGEATDSELVEGDVDESGLCTAHPSTCVGASPPEFALFDYQPQSCGFQATYGLDVYKDHVTLVGLLAAW